MLAYVVVLVPVTCSSSNDSLQRTLTPYTTIGWTWHETSDGQSYYIRDDDLLPLGPSVGASTAW